MDAAGLAILPKSPACPGPSFLPGSLSSGRGSRSAGLALASCPGLAGGLRWLVLPLSQPQGPSAPRPHSRLSWAKVFVCPLAYLFRLVSVLCSALILQGPPSWSAGRARSALSATLGNMCGWHVHGTAGMASPPSLPIQGASRAGLANCCLICHQFNYLTSLVTSTRLRFALRSQQMCRANGGRGRHEGFLVYKTSVFETCDRASFLRGCCSFQNGAVQTLLWTMYREQLFTLLTVTVEKWPAGSEELPAISLKFKLPHAVIGVSKPCLTHWLFLKAPQGCCS